MLRNLELLPLFAIRYQVFENATGDLREVAMHRPF